jgi:hypothetical protein
MDMEEQNSFIGDIISLLFIILFGLLILPAILLVLIFTWLTNLFTKEDPRKYENDIIYTMPCGHKFTKKDIEEANIKIQKARAKKKHKK